MVELDAGVGERSIGEDDVADHGEGQGEQGVGVEFDGSEKGEAREEEEKEKCDEEVEGGEGYLGVSEGGGLEDAFVDEDLDWGGWGCEKMLKFLFILGEFFSYNGCCRCGIDARADPESITETFRGGGGGDHGRRWWKPIQVEIFLIFFLIFFLLEKGLSLFIVVNRLSLLLFLVHSRQVMCAVSRRNKKRLRVCKSSTCMYFTPRTRRLDHTHTFSSLHSRD